MAKWTPEAAYVAERPPTHLNMFILTALSPEAEQDDTNIVRFNVSCKICGRDTFRIFSFPLIAPNPSPYYLIKPGETIRRPPHSLECVGCATKSCIFDARRDGYDGVLNGDCSYESGEDGEAAISGEFRVTISLAYNTELSELIESANSAAVAPSDLFDWFAIEGKSIGGGELFAEDYECA